MFILLAFAISVFASNNLCDDILSLRYRNFKASVIKIYDGDTIKADFGNDQTYKIRIIGIDAPESYYQGQTQGEAGEISKQYLQKILFLGDNVSIRTEYEAIDQYGRILGYVYKNDIDIGLEMLKAGMAINYTISPNLGKSLEYSNAVDVAINAKIGLWKEGFVEPYLWRRQIHGLGITRYIKDIRDGVVYKPKDYYKVPPQFRIFLTDSGK